MMIIRIMVNTTAHTIGFLNTVPIIDVSLIDPINFDDSSPTSMGIFK
jgi:hypothetical protein